VALQLAMVHLHDVGRDRYRFHSPALQDPHEPTMIMADIAANGLSLPERGLLPGHGRSLQGSAREVPRAHDQDVEADGVG